MAENRLFSGSPLFLGNRVPVDCALRITARVVETRPPPAFNTARPGSWGSGSCPSGVAPVGRLGRDAKRCRGSATTYGPATTNRVRCHGGRGALATVAEPGVCRWAGNRRLRELGAEKEA